MQYPEEKKRIAILGSTGSIGTQALDVMASHPGKFEPEVLTAYNNTSLLIQQAIRYVPNAVVVGNEAKYLEVKEALQHYPIKVYAGMDAINQVVQGDNIDLVLTAMVGYAGLQPTVNAIRAGKPIALANKETLVVAGDLVMELAAKHKVPILPVDSEHSAIFQCLQGEFHNKIEKIYLTASGGPFRTWDIHRMRSATRHEALKHPCWEMGAKITIDSASLMNKGLEVIEAKWLFGLTPSQIEVIIHPQSIIHSLVQFIDGSMKAQMGRPDMKHPIQYAFSYPYRLTSESERFSFLDYPRLDFEKPDFEKFRNLALAYNALERGGNAPCVLNAANEIAVGAFLEDKIGFLEMPDLLEKVMDKIAYIAHPVLEDYENTDREARQLARSLIGCN